MRAFNVPILPSNSKLMTLVLLEKDSDPVGNITFLNLHKAVLPIAQRLRQRLDANGPEKAGSMPGLSHPKAYLAVILSETSAYAIREGLGDIAVNDQIQEQWHSICSL